jgi:HTH-type transcriptional regulator / antitoxin HipB
MSKIGKTIGKKTVSLEELKERTLGKPGTKKRDEYEKELRMEVISELIKTSRKKKHLTQSELGKKIGVKKATISKLENDPDDITLSTIIRIFKALNAKVKLKLEYNDSEMELV